MAASDGSITLSSDEKTSRETAREDGSSRPGPLKRGGIRLLLMALAAIAVAAALFWLIRYETIGKYMQSTNDAYLQADAVTISPKVSGYVDRVFVTSNQWVRPGQPLLQIDPREYRAQAAQITAQIDVAQANARAVRAQVGEQQAGVSRAQADLTLALSDEAFARSEVTRYEPLAASGAETREKLAQLRSQARQASARVAAARSALLSARRRIGTLQAQVSQALSQGEVAQAQLAAADVNTGATLIRASIAGRVGDKSVQVGQFVQAGTRTMSIVPVQKLYVTANFKETQLGLMRAGQTVVLEVDALPGIELSGLVESLSPGTGAQFSLLPPQNATGNFTKIVQRVPVRIAIDAGPEVRQLLIPGMSVEVTVDTRSARGANERFRREQASRVRSGG